MKAILIGLSLVIAGIIEAVFVKDATALIFFGPFGIYFAVMGFRYGDRVLTNKFWEDRK